MHRYFQREIQADIRQRVQSEGANIEGILEAGKVNEAWYHLTQWYKQVRGK